jgi:hypothetical protein
MFELPEGRARGRGRKTTLVTRSITPDQHNVKRESRERKAEKAERGKQRKQRDREKGV